MDQGNGKVILPSFSALGMDLPEQASASFCSTQRSHWRSRASFPDTADSRCGLRPEGPVECEHTGTSNLREDVVGVEDADLDLLKDVTLPAIACWANGSKTFDSPADRTVVDGVELPVGTEVVFEECLEECRFPEPEGYTFEGSELSAERITISDTETVTLTAANTFSKDEGEDEGPETGGLAVTGASGVALAGVAGVLFLLAGAAVLLLRRERGSH